MCNKFFRVVNQSGAVLKGSLFRWRITPVFLVEFNSVGEIIQPETKLPSHNERFGAMAAVARRQFCGKLHVITPQQV
jgi:hypothetical protein